MTRVAQVTQAVSAMPVSAMRKASATPSALPEPAAMTFLIYEDNGGCYHWTIVADGGEILVRSAGFGSYEEAKHAASIIQRGASRAPFDYGPAVLPPVDLRARRDALRARRDALSARDRLDAERWLDEGGSFSSEAVTR